MDYVKRVLTDAEGLIRTYGWVQEAYGDEANGFCMVGAVETAGGTLLDRLADSPEFSGYMEAEEVVMNAIDEARELLSKGLRAGVGVRSFRPARIISYNDKRGRTKDQVLARFKRARKLRTLARAK